MAKWGFTTLITVGAPAGKNQAWIKNHFIRQICLGIILTVSPILSCAAANVTLAWDRSSNPIVAGYNIYFGGASGVYTNVIDAGTNTSATVSNLINGATYYFASTTYSTAGAVSAFSSEVSYTVPVVPVNQPPTLNPIGNLTINANAGAQTVNLTGISSGSASENQVLTVTATSSNTNLVSSPVVNYTTNNSSGSLTFSPVTGASGSAIITVTVNDGGASSNLTVKPFVVTVSLVTEQLRRVPGGQMVLTVSGPVGGNYVIQTSTNLVNWTPFSTNTIPPGGAVDIVDFNPNSPQKFYRATPYVMSAPTTTQSNFKLGSGVFSFTLSGPAGIYVIQSSTDLVNWTSFSTNTIPPGGSVQIIDPNTASSMKIYRAVPYVVNVPLAPQLSSFKLSNGVFSFVLNGPAGSNYVIQASTDLVHWTPFSTNTVSPDGSVVIVDLNPVSPQKFYRAAAFNNVVIPSPSPQLSGFKLGSAGFSFILNGQAGHTYDIQASPDLVTWTVIGTVTTSAGSSPGFTDTNSANFSRRFYRLHDTQP